LTDLHRAGLVSDPLARNHDLLFRPLARLAWVYNKVVLLPRSRHRDGGVIVFHGIDTVAEVVINKVNLFRSHDNQVMSFTFTFEMFTT
jgi:beta-galactosidase/beta-glucuronidase